MGAVRRICSLMQGLKGLKKKKNCQTSTSLASHPDTLWECQWLGGLYFTRDRILHSNNNYKYIHLIHGFTYKYTQIFCEEKYEQQAKCLRILYVKPLNKRFIIPAHYKKSLLFLASLFW